MLTYDDMYRDLFVWALDNNENTVLSQLHDWFDLSSEVMPLTSGQVKRLRFLCAWMPVKYQAVFS